MTIKTYPYIQNTITETQAPLTMPKASSILSSGTESNTSEDGLPNFATNLNTAKKALNAMAIDAAIAKEKAKGNSGLDLSSALAQMVGLPAASIKAAPTSDTSANETADITGTAGSSASVSTAQNVSTAPIITSDTLKGTNHVYHPDAMAADYAGSLSCSDELNSYFDEASATYGVDVKLLKSIAMTESSFNPNATSSSGAMGVMQLMDFTADELGVENPYDAKENIMGGAKLLSNLLHKYNNNLSLAAAAYNAGSGAVDACDGIPDNGQTPNYVRKVISYYKG